MKLVDEGRKGQEFFFFWFSEVSTELDIQARWRREKSEVTPSFSEDRLKAREPDGKGLWISPWSRQN